MGERVPESGKNIEQYQAPQTEGESNHERPITEPTTEPGEEAPVNDSAQTTEKPEEKEQVIYLDVGKILSGKEAINPVDIQVTMEQVYLENGKDAA